MIQNNESKREYNSLIHINSPGYLKLFFITRDTMKDFQESGKPESFILSQDYDGQKVKL